MDNTNALEQAKVTLPVDIDAQIQQALIGREMLNKLFATVLQQGIDFDRIPGTDKPTLYKAGGELLCQVFKLANGKPEMLFANEDFDNGLFSYTIGIPILSRDTGEVIAYGIGAANSHEIKYKYRYVKADDATAEKERVLNPEPADSQNTLIKMASKRAFVDGVLKATGASRMFTQDTEDMPWLKDEKASSKQIEYAKMLFKDKSTEEAFAETVTIIGRTIEKWDDLTRPEASQIIEAKKPKGQPSPPTTDKSESITEAQAKRMFAISKGNADLCKKVIAKYGYEKSDQVKKIDYEKICKDIETEVKSDDSGLPDVAEDTRTCF